MARPPIQSDNQPQNWRLRNAIPSSSESMAAPLVAEILRSPQSAGKCVVGIAIGTQHRTEARQRSEKRVREFIFVGCDTLVAASGVNKFSGAVPRRKIREMGTIETTANTPKKIIVWYQSVRAVVYRSNNGQMAPPTYCPLAISASAVPRCRSNQLMTVALRMGEAQKAEPMGASTPKRK